MIKATPPHNDDALSELLRTTLHAATTPEPAVLARVRSAVIPRSSRQFIMRWQYALAPALIAIALLIGSASMQSNKRGVVLPLQAETAVITATASQTATLAPTATQVAQLDASGSQHELIKLSLAPMAAPPISFTPNPNN